MPLNPVPNWPASLDSLPDPTNATYMDDDGFEQDLILQKLNAIAELLEAAFGINESSAQRNPLANTVLTSLTNDKSKWGKVLSSMLSVTTAEAALSADVALNNTANFFDGPSVSLAAGTWLIQGTVQVTDTAGAAAIIAKLWDGTTVAASNQFGIPGASFSEPITLSGIVSPGSTTTYKISCRDLTSTSGAIQAATPAASQGNNSSYIRAIRIA